MEIVREKAYSRMESKRWDRNGAKGRERTVPRRRKGLGKGEEGINRDGKGMKERKSRSSLEGECMKAVVKGRMEGLEQRRSE